MDGELGDFAGPENRAVIDLHVNAHFGDWRDVGRVESIKRCRTDLDGAISSKQLCVEENANFRDDVVARDNQRAHKIVLAVSSRLEDWDLRSGDDDGLAEILKHK